MTEYTTTIMQTVDGITILTWVGVDIPHGTVELTLHGHGTIHGMTHGMQDGDIIMVGEAGIALTTATDGMADGDITITTMVVDGEVTTPIMADTTATDEGVIHRTADPVREMDDIRQTDEVQMGGIRVYQDRHQEQDVVVAI